MYCAFSELVFRNRGIDCYCNLLCNLHEFIKSHPTFVARTIACRTPPWTVYDKIRDFLFGESDLHQFLRIQVFCLFFALGTEFSGKALRNDHRHRRRQHVGWYPDVCKTADSGRAIVRVESAENEMAGHGRFDGDLSGFHVPDLADHNYIRVLPQKSLESHGKCHADIALHVHLIHSPEVEFHGIFCCKYLGVFLVERTEN